MHIGGHAQVSMGMSGQVAKFTTNYVSQKICSQEICGNGYTVLHDVTALPAKTEAFQPIAYMKTAYTWSVWTLPWHGTSVCYPSYLLWKSYSVNW